MMKLKLYAILLITITTFTIALSTQVLADDSLYVSEDGVVAVGTQDLDGSPAVGQVTIKGTSSDGSTNILVGRDSAESNVFSVNTDGKITGKTITLSESITNDTSELQLYTYMAPTTTSSSTSYHVGSVHYLRPIISSGVTQLGYEMGQRIQSFRNSRETSTDDNGTLTALYGQNIQYGHYYTNTSASPVTTNVYGICLSPYYKTGTVTNWYDLYISAGSSGGAITNRYGIYQASTAAKNYFAGKVGIGTTSPDYNLHVYENSENHALIAMENTEGKAEIHADEGGLWLDAGDNGADIGITSAGYVGIGTTSPDAVFNVRGGTDVGLDTDSPGFILIGGLDGYNIGMDKNEIMARNNGALSSLYIQYGGGALYLKNTWYSSDLRLKENVNTLEKSLDKINKLRGVSFEWVDKTDDDKQHMGLIAQEVEEVFPDLVETDEDGNKAVAYISLIAPLIESVKELKAENDNLYEMIEELEDRIENLEKNK